MTFRVVVRRLPSPIASCCGDSPSGCGLTRYFDRWHAGVASWSQPCWGSSDEEPKADVPAAASSKTATERLSSRLTRACLRLPPKRCKYGFCARHQRALEIRVGYSGRFAGRPVARCPLFRVISENDQRACWTQKAYHGRMEDLPKAVRLGLKELREDLRWSLQHGPQTK